ncbi:cytochrome c-type biogenesis protein [Dongia rigui]|uniref:Cytochrome c-type biogenesis protein n=1 Tax=Dongia rigui TaxID=940149 RepID=A0ABU5DW72_9PROT|nr:cytochrome c-type biogenesis protein [Dongia rigui]MDY0871553.1 cytochrome c-type biogenesis protein [Dongia rigui]
MNLARHIRVLLAVAGLGLAGLALPQPAHAQVQVADAPLTDPALEARARALMKQVRCVVCQAQSIDESDAGIASDMRRLIRQQIAAGESDAAILTYLSDRYGDFVLFKPPFKAATALLWAGPFVLLVIGGLIIVFFFRRRSATPIAALSATELARINAALGAEGLPSPAPEATNSAERRDA